MATPDLLQAKKAPSYTRIQNKRSDLFRPFCLVPCEFGAPGVEWAVSGGGLSLRRQAAFEVRPQAGGIAIPSGEDFRAILSAEEQARIAREINDHVRQSLEKGTEDLWNRLKSVVSHLVKRLREPDARYHASLVTNLLDLVELMPRLNVNQDEDLDRFASELRNQLGTLTARDLKKNDILRVATANGAAALLHEMDAVLRNRENTVEPLASLPTANDIFSHMSAYMEAQTQ